MSEDNRSAAVRNWMIALAMVIELLVRVLNGSASQPKQYPVNPSCGQQGCYYEPNACGCYYR